MNPCSWILTVLIIVRNITSLLSAPYEGFYFPDKFEKFKEYHPEKLNRGLIFDHDYHIDDHRRYSHQQQQQMHDQNDPHVNSDDQTSPKDEHTFENGASNNDDYNDNNTHNFDNLNKQNSESNENHNFDNHNNQNSESNENNKNHNFDINNQNTNSGQFDSDSAEFSNNFDWQSNNNNNNGFQRDSPAIANTVCESRCNNNVSQQYNPICGNDGLTYYNDGRMNCAQICGKSVQFVRIGSCSSALIH